MRARTLRGVRELTIASPYWSSSPVPSEAATSPSGGASWAW